MSPMLARVALLHSLVAPAACFAPHVLRAAGYRSFAHPGGLPPRAGLARLAAEGGEGGAQAFKLPMDKLTITFTRSSGPGGQNVNKVSTAAEVRVDVRGADWLPEEVKGRLMEQQANRINKAGELVVTSQEHRTQFRNREEAINKVKEMLAQAFIEPKERNMYEGISDKNKRQRKESKRRRAEVKKGRGNMKNWD